MSGYSSRQPYRHPLWFWNGQMVSPHSAPTELNRNFSLWSSGRIICIRLLIYLWFWAIGLRVQIWFPRELRGYQCLGQYCPRPSEEDTCSKVGSSSIVIAWRVTDRTYVYKKPLKKNDKIFYFEAGKLIKNKQTKKAFSVKPVATWESTFPANAKASLTTCGQSQHPFKTWALSLSR